MWKGQNATWLPRSKARPTPGTRVAAVWHRATRPFQADRVTSFKLGLQLGVREAWSTVISLIFFLFWSLWLWVPFWWWLVSEHDVPFFYFFIHFISFLLLLLFFLNNFLYYFSDFHFLLYSLFFIFYIIFFDISLLFVSQISFF